MPDTIAGALTAGARLLGGTDSPRLDAEVLLGHVLGKDRTYLRTWPERRLDPAQASHFNDLLGQRRDGVPIAYLTGEREFWSRCFVTNPSTLIPRPETELLVELALEALPPGPQAVLELGTGSGAIAITLAAERPEAHIVAVELNPDTLETAQLNARRLGTPNVRFLQGSWFEPVPAGSRFAMIVSNPPYIAENDPHLGQGDLRFEPPLALASGPDGLSALRHIIDGAPAYLKPGGILLLEHGFDQSANLNQLLTQRGYQGIAHIRDLQGNPRVTLACHANDGPTAPAERP